MQEFFIIKDLVWEEDNSDPKLPKSIAKTLVGTFVIEPNPAMEDEDDYNCFMTFTPTIGVAEKTGYWYEDEAVSVAAITNRRILMEALFLLGHIQLPICKKR